MSLTGVLRTGVSGMNAQTNRISTVAENIQNASTTGYKRTSVEFSSLLLESSGAGNYNSGAVQSTVRRAISEGGPSAFTTSKSDLAIQGNGFFAVQSISETVAGGTPQKYLTRAGNFVLDTSRIGQENTSNTSGKVEGPNLVNAAGFMLLGYKYDSTSKSYSTSLSPVELPAASQDITYGSDGTIAQVNADGSQTPIYKIPLAQVASPDQMTPKAGNVFEITSQAAAKAGTALTPTIANSVDDLMGSSGVDGRGTIKSGTIEQSNVDVATELTTMIEAQSAFTANSKTFMTGNEMLETLMNLKR